MNAFKKFQKQRMDLLLAVILLPLILFGVLLMLGLDKESPATAVGTEPAPVGQSPASATGQWSDQSFPPKMLLADPIGGARTFQEALTGQDPVRAEAAVMALAGERVQCLHRLSGTRHVPHSPGSLSSGLRCVQALHSLRPALRAWARGKERELAKWVGGEHRGSGATLALGFGRPEPEVLSALIPRIGSASTGENILAALTELGLEAPQVVLEAVRAAPAKDSPRDRINRLRLEARLGPSREAGCKGLAERVIQEDDEGRRLAVQALAELDGRCDEAAGPLLEYVRSARPPEGADPKRWARESQHEIFRRLPAAQALAYTGLSHWAELWALEQEVGKHDSLLLSTLQNARDQLVDNDQVRRMGVTELVLKHPGAMQGVDRPEVVLGPCPAERLGLSPGAELPFVPGCVLEVWGGSALMRPSTAWQAQARGMALADFETAP